MKRGSEIITELCEHEATSLSDFYEIPPEHPDDERFRDAFADILRGRIESAIRLAQEDIANDPNWENLTKPWSKL